MELSRNRFTQPDRRTGLDLHRSSENVHGRAQDRREVGRPLPRRRRPRNGCKRLDPVQIGGRLDLPASTVHAVLTRCRFHPSETLRRAALPG